MIRVDRHVHAGVAPRLQPDEVIQALRSEHLGQGVSVLVIPGWLRVDGDPEPGGALGGFGVGPVGVDEIVTARPDRAVDVGRFHGIEHGVDAGIAGDVRRHLPAEPVAGADDVLQLVGIDPQVAAVFGIGDAIERKGPFAVGLAHIRRAVERAAVHAELDRAVAHPIVAVTGLERHGADRLLGGLHAAIRVDPDRHRHAHGQAALRLQPAERLEILGARGSLGDARDAEFVVAAQQTFERLEILFFGDAAAGQELGEQRATVFRHTGRFAVRSEMDLAARGSAAVPGDPGRLQRGPVQDLHLAVCILPREYGGIVGSGGGEFGGRRDAPFADARGIDTRQLDPTLRCRVAYFLSHPLLDFCDRVQLHKGLQCLAARGAGGMDMGLDQSGNDGLSMRIDDASAGADARADVGVGAHGDEHAVLDRDGPGGPKRGVDRQDIAVENDEVGGWFRGEGGQRGGGDQDGPRGKNGSGGVRVFHGVRRATVECNVCVSPVIEPGDF